MWRLRRPLEALARFDAALAIKPGDGIAYNNRGNALLDLNRAELPAEANPTAGTGGGDAPVCIKDYATGGNVIARQDPVFSEHRFNAVPVRIIIDKEGKVKHIHFLSAFPDQAKAITDAFQQWKFKPYLRDRHPVEVETGIMFGRAPGPRASPDQNLATE
jgi:hypothetical protein